VSDWKWVKSGVMRTHCGISSIISATFSGELAPISRQMSRTLQNRNLRPGGSRDRVGKLQLRIWRAFVGYNRPLSTAELLALCRPELAPGKRYPEGLWLRVRTAAERYAIRATPRTRPLTWVAKPDLHRKMR
jgi:hypothetical protein